jgi:hypothetical protein
MSDLRINSLEAAVIQRMLAEPSCIAMRRSVNPGATLKVVERSASAVGFLTSFGRDAAARLFGDGTSMRWGKVVGRLNSEVDVDFVVYVDDGYVTGVEGVTFGGEPWPPRINQFELMEIPDG